MARKLKIDMRTVFQESTPESRPRGAKTQRMSMLNTCDDILLASWEMRDTCGEELGERGLVGEGGELEYEECNEGRRSSGTASSSWWAAGTLPPFVMTSMATTRRSYV